MKSLDRSLRQLSIDNGLPFSAVKAAYVKAVSRGNLDCADLKIQVVWEMKKQRLNAGRLAA